MERIPVPPENLSMSRNLKNVSLSPKVFTVYLEKDY